MEVLSTDILVIGSGLAGIFAALEAERSGLQVLLLGKFAIGRGTNTSLANAAFTAASSSFSKDEHLKATFEAGKGLNHQQLVKVLVEDGPEAISRLREFGVPMAERRLGYVVDRPKTLSTLPGILLIDGLLERLKQSPIKLLRGLIVFDLVVEEGKVQGAFGFLKDGKPCLVRSKAVILAAGGAGASYRRNDNQKSILGDGYALALRAGLPLFDLEFVQFYPLVLAEPRLSSFCLYPPYLNEMRLLNTKGEDLLEKLGIQKDLNRAAIRERDRLSIGLYEVSQRDDVYLDLTHVPVERWEEYPLNFLRKSRFPFPERPFLVSPAVHFFMGGVEIDEKGRTALPGLFAAGEVAWGVHGANRLGGNAMTECAVFGALAGRSAAEYGRTREKEDASSNLFEAWTRRWERKTREYLRKKRGPFDHPGDLLRNLKDVAWRYAGPVRDESLMEEGLDRLASIERRIEAVYPAQLNDLFRKRDLENIALLLKAILKGSLLRTESRGSFYRRDFPDQDDPNWRRNTCYQLEKEELRVTHRPVLSDLIECPKHSPN